MRYRDCSSVLLLAVVAATTALAADAPVAVRRVHQVAVARPQVDGSPVASDVIMRSLTLRTATGEDGFDTLRALSQFHVTRLEWAYIHDREAIAKVRGSGRLFGGAASSAMSHVSKLPAGVEHAELACVDLNGTPVVPTWKRTWRPPGNWWMCVNNPLLEERYLDYLKACVDAGAQVLQRDEPWGNYRAVDWGGCFCQHCMAAFRQDLEQSATAEELQRWGVGDVRSFDYRQRLIDQHAPVGDVFKRWDGGDLKQRFIDFQMQATLAFHQRTRSALNEYAGRRVAISCNNGCRRWTPIEMEFDWCFGELSYRDANPVFIHDALREAAGHGRPQVVTMPKKSDQEDPEAWCRLTRQTIAMSYACGGHCMVPWDVYMPGDAPRYFGTPEQYADLFGFIRASARHLDEYEYAGACGPGLSCEDYGDAFPVQLPAGRAIHAVLRAVPGQAEAPVVLHLVDWSDDPRPFSLSILPAAFFGGRSLKVTLLTPTAYDRARHEAADATRVYDSLVETTLLAQGYEPTLSIPALSPWGIVVIEPDRETANGVWPPTIRTESGGLYRRDLTVRMATATDGATMHFTTDGSEPTVHSPRYASPIEFDESTCVRAIAVSPDGIASPVATREFRLLADVPEPAMPSDERFRENLRLWLAADRTDTIRTDGQPVQTWHAAMGIDARALPHKTFTGLVTQPPAFKQHGIGEHPVIAFDGVDDSLVVPDFANECLAGRAFTIFMVSQAESGSFGMCGNGVWGTGGTPRLYLQRSAFHYDVLDKPIKLPPPGTGPCISVFMHDGRETICAGTNGVLSPPVSGLPVVKEFGSGGNLAIPFWSGNQNCAGQMAEIIVYDRQLTEAERQSIEIFLADKYAIPYKLRWEAASP